MLLLHAQVDFVVCSADPVLQEPRFLQGLYLSIFNKQVFARGTNVFENLKVHPRLIFAYLLFLLFIQVISHVVEQ